MPLTELSTRQKKSRTSPLAAAHALHALTSLAGIMGMPVAILQAFPTAPIAQPLIYIVRLSGAWLPLVWSLGSLALWLLLLSRLYRFSGVWDCMRQQRLCDEQPCASGDQARARTIMSCLRME